MHLRTELLDDGLEQVEEEVAADLLGVLNHLEDVLVDRGGSAVPPEDIKRRGPRDEEVAVIRSTLGLDVTFEVVRRGGRVGQVLDADNRQPLRRPLLRFEGATVDVVGQAAKRFRDPRGVG